MPGAPTCAKQASAGLRPPGRAISLRSWEDGFQNHLRPKVAGPQAVVPVEPDNLGKGQSAIWRL